MLESEILDIPPNPVKSPCNLLSCLGLIALTASVSASSVVLVSDAPPAGTLTVDASDSLAPHLAASTVATVVLAVGTTPTPVVLSSGSAPASLLPLSGPGALTISGSSQTDTGMIVADASLSLTKLGSGTLTLGASNTYAGVTTLTSGTLRLSTGALGGSVAIGGATTVSTGSVLSPGSGGSLTLNPASPILLSDSSLTLTGLCSGVSFSFLSCGDFQFDLPDLSFSGSEWDVSRFTTAGSVASPSFIPEPTTSLLAGLGLLGLLRRRRN